MDKLSGTYESDPDFLAFKAKVEAPPPASYYFTFVRDSYNLLLRSIYRNEYQPSSLLTNV